MGTWSHKSLPPRIRKATNGSFWSATEIIQHLVQFVVESDHLDDLASYLEAKMTDETGSRVRRSTRSWPEYSTWNNMRQRCENQNRPEYHHYGGRGIKVCDRWQRFENFYADMGDRPEGLSLDRMDNNKGYEPGNCRWATRTEQNRNRRNVKPT